MYARLARLGLRHWRSLPWRARLPRALFLVSFLIGFPLFELGNAICLALDRLLFPKCAREEVREPVFIVGNARSGTTLLHRLMTLDTDHFFCFRTWELWFPARIQKECMALVGRLDAALGDPLRKAILRLEARYLSAFAQYHQIGCFLPEEDDKLFGHVLASVELAWFFPSMELGRQFMEFDCALPLARRRRLMAFYRVCLQRQASFRGHGRSLLSKNPMFCGKMASLLDAFPDARFIYLVRNPVDVVGSVFSMSRVIWQEMAGTVDPELHQRVYDAVRFGYRHPLAVLASQPAERHCVLRYEDLTRDPLAAVEEVYRHFGWALSTGVRGRLAAEQQRMRTYRSAHQYTLDPACCTPAQLVADLGEVFQRFGYELPLDHRTHEPRGQETSG